MKRIVLILLLSFAYVAQAQYLAPMNAKNSGSWSMGLLRIDSSFNLRLFDTAVTKLAFPSNLNNRWARQGQRLYIYNGSFFELADNVPAIDTSSLSARINARVKYTDTLAMLGGYLKKVDTSSLSTRIDARVKYIDTAAMLSHYWDGGKTAAALALKQNYTDTTVWDATKKNLADTSAALRAIIPLGTDTTSLSNRINARVKYSDTSAMLAPYATDAQVALKLNIVDTANMRIRPTAGSNMTITGTYPNVTFSASSTPTDSTRFATLYRVDTAKANLRTSINTKLNSADTTSLSNRINLKLNISDTNSMLGGYLRKVDTLTLSNRIDARVKYTDTASMLSSYYLTAQATAALALKQNYTDTTTYDATKKNLADTALALRALIPSGVDTTSLSNRIDARVKYTDTASMLAPYLPSAGAAATYVPYTGATTNVNLGTHTISSYNSVVNHTSGSGVAASITKGGSGEALTVVKSSGSGNAASITGGVTLLSELHLNTDLADAYIASAANWNAKIGAGDTSAMLGGYLRKVDTASLSNRIDAKVGYGTLTTNYVPKATSTTAIGNSQIFDNGTNVGINTATPGYTLDVNGKGRFQTSCLISSTVDYGWPFQVNNQNFRIYSDGTFGRHTGLNFNTVNWNLAGARSQVQLGTAGSAYENQLVIICQEGPVRINPYGTNYSNRSVIIGNTNARTEKLQVDGTSYFSGSTLVGTGTANASALLEVNSTTQGLGLPSMTTTQQNAIATPRTGLEIYNSTLLTPQFYNGSVWTGGWNKRGNAGTDAANDFIGTSDNVDVVFKRNNVTSGWLNATNTSFGVSSMPTTTTAQNNVAFGTSALSALTTGGSNSAFGRSALAACSTGTNNVAVGGIALQTLTTGGNNIAVGSGGVLQQNNGNNNTAVGYRPMLTNTTGANNSAYGYQAMYFNLTGNNNSAFGYEALQNNSVGTSNVAMGVTALNRTTGSNNVGIGLSAAHFSTTGSNNTSIGHNSNLNLGTGENNTALGANTVTSTSTGSNNIAVGYNASASGSGLKNLTVAYSGSVPLSTGSNQMNIGNVLWGADCSGTGSTAAGSLSVGVNTPNASALLDLTSTTKGFLPPRMTATQAAAIATPAEGLMVYVTNTGGVFTGKGWWGWNGAAWEKLNP